MKKNLVQHILSSTISNYLFFGFRLLINIAGIPVFMRVFGEEAFSIYLLAFSIPIALSFLDFGASKSLIRYSSEYVLDKDHKKYEQAYSHSVTLNLYAVLVIFLILFSMGFLCTKIFVIEAAYHGLAKYMFLMASLYAIFSFLGFIPVYTLQGFHIFKERNMYQYFGQLSVIAVIAIVYFFKIDIRLFAILMVLSRIIEVGLDFFLIHKKKLLEHINYKLVSFKELFRSEFFIYTKDLFIFSMIAFGSNQVDRLTISIFASASLIAAYVIITKPFFVVRSLFANAYSVFNPLLVEFNRDQNTERLKFVSKRFTQIGFTVLFFGTVMIFLFIKPVLAYWVPSVDYSHYGIWAVLAIVNYCLTAYYGLIFRLFYVTDRTKTLIKIESFTVACNIIVSIALTIIYKDIFGVIIGSTVQMVLAFIIFGFVTRKQFQYNLNDYIPYQTLIQIGLGILYAYVIIHFGWNEVDSLWQLIWKIAIVGLPILVLNLVYFQKAGLLQYFLPKSLKA